MSRSADNEAIVEMAEALDADPMGLAEFFASSDFERMDETRQTDAVDALLAALRQRRAREPIRFTYDPTKTNRQIVSDILALAHQSGKDGPVAQYLVGAKLALRFPDKEIGNESYSTADVQLNRPGDFVVGDTVFHVTVSPQLGHYEKCRKNLAKGHKVYLLTPDHCVVGARQNVSAIAAGRISVESIESFVAQNLDELAVFSRDDARKRLRELLETYNRRVDATENDKSMLIDLPGNLR